MYSVRILKACAVRTTCIHQKVAPRCVELFFGPATELSLLSNNSSNAEYTSLNFLTASFSSGFACCCLTPNRNVYDIVKYKMNGAIKYLRDDRQNFVRSPFDHIQRALDGQKPIRILHLFKNRYESKQRVMIC